MNQKLGMIEFFAMEAGEYLDRLDQIVSTREPPNGEEFQRVTRALRGAALMANQQPLAAAAGAFEHLARAVREGSRAWDEATRQLVIRAVDDFRKLVRAAGNWTEAESGTARDLGAQLATAAGRPRPSTAQRASERQLDSGTRAFVAREGATLASALDRASKMLGQNPQAPDPLQSVTSAMQPLRGLASLSDLPPMADVLDGVDLAVTEVTRDTALRADAGAVFAAAARAVSQTTREVATDGRANADGPEVLAFAQTLRALLGLDQGVVPIEQMYFDDAGPHVLSRGTPPVGRSALGDVELVSHGEHLRQAADAIERATGEAQRALRTLALAGTLRALESAGGSALADAAGTFARACRGALAAGTPNENPAAFATSLRDASTVLSAAASGNAAELARQLETVARQLAPGAPPAPAERAPASEAKTPAPPARSAPAKASAPAATTTGDDEESADLAGSFTRLERYLDQLGLGDASIDELLAGPPAAPTPAAPTAAPATVGTEQDIVPIESLCFSGSAALARALELKDTVQTAVAEHRPDALDLLEEVFDLVRLSTNA